jgi:hypothetical protein
MEAHAVADAALISPPVPEAVAWGIASQQKESLN